ncbi:MAG: Gfo/Idh/MocA family protein, partial [Anaerolineae bacterium]
MSNPVTAVIVGAGHRALTYAAYSKHRPDELKIVGVADPMEYRRRYVAELYGLRPDQCFETAEELAAGPQIADAVINGTMDQQHVPTSLPLLNAGYHLLLEKPFAVNESEMWDLLAAARKNDRKVMICHVMRYAPFSVAMKRCVARGDIGEIISVQTLEHVSYHHMAVGYVRGKWNRKDLCGSPMLMAKCCHDLDFITWMKSGIAPVRVSSFGCNMQFRPEKAPEGAGTRCLVDCPIEESCLYSARKHYIDHPQRWSFYVWAGLEQM